MRPRASFSFHVQRWPIPKSSGALWQRSLTQTLGQSVVRVAGSLLMVVYLPVSLTLRRRGTMGNDIFDVLQCTNSSTSSVVQVGTLPLFLDQWRSNNFNRLCVTCLKAAISSFGHGYHCSVISSGSGGWVSTFVSMCASNFLFTIGLLPGMKSLRGLVTDC